MKARPYQEQAIRSIEDALQHNGSTLAVLATGTGKTFVFSDVARRRANRVLVMAHTTELVDQARDKIAAVVGEEPDVEMANRRADVSLFRRTKCIVTSVQTQATGRMERFDPMKFDLLVIDEAHRAGASSYQQVIDHYRQNPNLKVLGVTATPDRCAGLFDSVAFEYPIRDAVDDGWLCPIRQRYVEVGALDYSKVRSVNGDLSAVDLAALLEAEEVMHGTVVPVLDLYKRRPTIVFCPTVDHAERMAEVFNRYEPGLAAAVSGNTPRIERAQIVDQFRRGTFKILCNVGVFTEGFDAPEVGMVVMARATKSRTLYAQMLGRGTRTMPGVVDHIERADDRRHAIEMSAKPHVEVLDFVGNSGRHRLVSAIDIIRPDVDDATRTAAIARASKSENLHDMEAITEDEMDKIAREREHKRLREIAKRERVQARVNYCTEFVDPFGIASGAIALPGDRFQPVSEGMQDILSRNGVDHRRLSFDAAKRVVRDIIMRSKQGLCSYKQAHLLRKFGIDAKRMTRAEANAAIDTLKSRGWKR
jgi:superfamily II DNA or RNA helicase